MGTFWDMAWNILRLKLQEEKYKFWIFPVCVNTAWTWLQWRLLKSHRTWNVLQAVWRARDAFHSTWRSYQRQPFCASCLTQANMERKNTWRKTTVFITIIYRYSITYSELAKVKPAVSSTCIKSSRTSDIQLKGRKKKLFYLENTEHTSLHWLQ